jgi:plasmid replication initiation protein
MAKTELEIGDYKVRKSNDLVEAKFKLPLIEQRILALCFSKVNPKKENLQNPYRFSVKEYCDLTGAEERGMFKTIREAVENLKTRNLSKYDPDLKRERIYGWLDKADIWDSGAVDIYIHDELANDLLVTRKFSEYLLRNCLDFKSKYTLRFFEILQNWSYLGQKKINVDNLREMIGLEVNDYPRYTDFKKRILKKAISEINSETEMFVEFNEFRKDRKVQIIEFVITASPPTIKKTRVNEIKSKKLPEDKKVEEWLVPSKEDQIVEKLSKFGIGAMIGVKLIEDFGAEKVEVSVNKTNNDVSAGKFSENVNLAGVVINRIKDPTFEVNKGPTSSQDLKKRRAEMMNWLSNEGYEYESYYFEGNWVGVQIGGTIAVFMSDDFQSKVKAATNYMKKKTGDLS